MTTSGQDCYIMSATEVTGTDQVAQLEKKFGCCKVMISSPSELLNQVRNALEASPFSECIYQVGLVKVEYTKGMESTKPEALSTLHIYQKPRNIMNAYVYENDDRRCRIFEYMLDNNELLQASYPDLEKPGFSVK